MMKPNWGGGGGGGDPNFFLSLIHVRNRGIMPDLSDQQAKKPHTKSFMILMNSSSFFLKSFYHFQ